MRSRSINALRVYPNPAKNSISLEGYFPTAARTKIIISDMNGNQKLQKDILVTSGVIKLPVEVSTWSKGIYFITVTDGKTNSRYSFIKE